MRRIIRQRHENCSEEWPPNCGIETSRSIDLREFVVSMTTIGWCAKRSFRQYYYYYYYDMIRVYNNMMANVCGGLICRSPNTIVDRGILVLNFACLAECTWLHHRRGSSSNLTDQIIDIQTMHGWWNGFGASTAIRFRLNEKSFRTKIADKWIAAACITLSTKFLNNEPFTRCAMIVVIKLDACLVRFDMTHNIISAKSRN